MIHKKQIKVWDFHGKVSSLHGSKIAHLFFDELKRQDHTFTNDRDLMFSFYSIDFLQEILTDVIKTLED